MSGGGVNASIPLQSINQAPAAQMQQVQLMQQFNQVAAQQRAAAVQNQMRTILAQPGAIDPRTGSPSMNAITQITRLDPNAGMQLRQHDAAIRFQDSKTADTVNQNVLDIGTSAMTAYDNALKTMPPDAAKRAAQEVYTQGYDRLMSSGLIGDDQKQHFSPEFDPARTATNVDYLKNKLAAQKEQREAEHQAAEDTERHRHDLATEPSAKGEDKWEIVNDKDGTQYRYNPITAQSTTLDGKPYTPQGGAQKPGSSTPASEDAKYADTIARDRIEKENARRATAGEKPLSGAEEAEYHLQAKNVKSEDLAHAKDEAKKIDPEVAHNIAEQYVETGNPMVLAGFRRSPAMISQLEGEILKVQREKGMTAQQVARQSAEFAAFSQGVRAFEAGGKLEPTVRSLSVATDHLGTLGEAATALNNGNLRLFNQIGNTFSKETGSPAPTDFDGIKRIVSEELVKAVTGSAGAMGDREALQADLDKANSPAQLQSLVERYKQLMAGQLSGIKQTYSRLNTGKDFDKEYLTPGAQREVAKYSEHATGPDTQKPAAGIPAPIQALKDKGASLHRSPDGTMYYDSKNDKFYDADGKPIARPKNF